jgi:uncharacterized protein Usg
MRGPAPYPNRDEQETLAIDTFRNLVDHRQVKLEIRDRDKFPNTDGYIEIVDDERRPIGKLEAQVRKLPDNYGTSPKLPCPLSLIEYAKVTTIPVLFIGVDVVQRKAYWLPVSEDLVRGKEIRDEQQTITVSFHPGRTVEEKETRYVIEWLRIAEDYQTKLREYEKLAVTLAQLSKSSTLTPATAASPGFREIHEFLDEFNAMLDGPFYTVKRRFYPGAWKVGLAYRDFSANSITYTIFPIRPEENEAQIKEIDSTRNLFAIDGVRGYFKENPIRTRPKQHAVDVIQDSVKQILEGKLLDHKGSNALAREFMFAIADRLTEQMGLEEKDNYTIAQIETAFYCHLPIWVHEAVELMVRENRNGVKSPIDCLYRKPYFDPDMLRSQIMPQEMKVLDERVKAWLERHDPIPKIPLGYERLPLGFFEEYHSSLISEGVTDIQRLYDPPDYSRMPHGGFIWEPYSEQSVERNLKNFFDNFPSAYSSIIDGNFPQLRDHLAPFHGATRVIVVFDVKDRYGPAERPGISFWHLKCKDESRLHLDLIKRGQDTDLEARLKATYQSNERSLELNGKIYQCLGGLFGALRFIYDDMPMLGFIYKELQQAFEKYFAALKE